MMAEVVDSDTEDVKQRTLRELHCQFFEMVPIRRMKWKNQVNEASEIGPDVQKLVLQATVCHPLCKSYPPYLSYQKSFMKQFLHLLEGLDIDICDEVYEQYTELLSAEEEEDDTLCYKTYQLPCGETISLQESVHLISQGTTGLSTWQAAQHLAEWAFENSKLLDNRNIVELGSGLGLTGIAICKQCSPRIYNFTDCHSQVLFLLAKNIELNMTGACLSTTPHSPSRTKDVSIMRKIRRQLSLNAEAMINELGDIVEVCLSPTTPPADDQDGIVQELTSDFCDFELSSTHWDKDASKPCGTLKKDGRVALAKLDWQNIDEELIAQLKPDIILAADVVWDTAIVPFLVRTLKALLSRKQLTPSPAPMAFIASTVRNEDTRDQFLYTLTKEDLRYEPVAPPREKIFHYDTSIPIEILRIYV